MDPDGSPAPTADQSQQVVIADDFRDAADALASLCELLGHSAVAVYNGTGAVLAISRYHPAVAILDIEMPDMDGFAVARRIRRDARLKDVRLVALSSHRSPSDLRQSKAAGFERHLIKPLQQGQLSELLQALAPLPPKT